jgi:ubiquinone/menaquinone biosynthesis C-methylase UbiE
MNDKHFVVDAFSEIASRYENVVDGEMRKFWGWSYEGFIENMVNHTSIGKNDLVLDIASGTAVIPLKLADDGKTSGKIVGLDITYAMLEKGQQKISRRGKNDQISLVCGNALSMPLRSETFDTIVCGLATHHLNVGVLLDEIVRLLRPGGQLTIADVGGAPAWRTPVVNAMIRTATFLYFLPKEGYARARVEASALSNVLTPTEWEDQMASRRFQAIQVNELPKSNAWAPAPLMIRALKGSKGGLQ